MSCRDTCSRTNYPGFLLGDDLNSCLEQCLSLTSWKSNYSCRKPPGSWSRPKLSHNLHLQSHSVLKLKIQIPLMRLKKNTYLLSDPEQKSFVTDNSLMKYQSCANNHAFFSSALILIFISSSD